VRDIENPRAECLEAVIRVYREAFNRLYRAATQEERDRAAQTLIEDLKNLQNKYEEH